MSDVRVAISIDTAVAGPISTNEVGPNNGWLVDVLAEAYTGGAWTSFSGGGEYNSTPFRDAGYLVLALEDNYPFKEKHTAADLPGIIRPASVQQMGEQTLSITRCSAAVISRTPGANRRHSSPYAGLGLVHYPQAWSLPLAITAGVLLVLALGLEPVAQVRLLARAARCLWEHPADGHLTVVGISLLQPTLPASSAGKRPPGPIGRK